MVFSAKNKRQFGIRSHRNLFVALFLFLVFGISGIVTLILNTNAQTVPVHSVEIKSAHANYDNGDEGSWKITKSAEWTDIGKARITFKVDTETAFDHSKVYDILMVIDDSGSMEGGKMNQVKADATDLVDTLLDNPENKIALVTFNTSATIISGFTNDKPTMLSHINSIVAGGCTNYNDGLLKANTILDDYEKQDNRDLILLFLTDGFPNEDTPNEVAAYQLLKTKYPYLTINGIQYEMGDEVLQPIIDISDNQFIADMETLNNVLFEASVTPYLYDDFVITDYIDDDYWLISGPESIETTVGNATLTYDGSTPKITWDLSNRLRAGSRNTLTIDILLKPEIYDLDLLLPTNRHEVIHSSITDAANENIDSNLTPILKSVHDVTYDANAPNGCNVVGQVPSTTTHTIYTTVEISDNVLSCPGYSFRGWTVMTTGVSWINEDYFRMPDMDVVIRGVWSKLSITKSMDGVSHIRGTATFDTGSTVNAKIKKLSGQSGASSSTANTTITAIERADTLPVSGNVYENDNKISSSTSMLPIYAWFDNGVIYYYSDAEELYLNKNASSMFYYLRNLSTIDNSIGEWITSNTTNMSSMFYNAGYNATDFSIDISNWDVSNVTDMSNMFYANGYNATTWTIGDLSGWNVSNVVYMDGMFDSCGYNYVSETWTVGDLRNWNVSKVTNMNRMFHRAGSRATTWSVGDLSDWDVSKVTNMSDLFGNTGGSAVSWSVGDLSDWDVSNVKDMSYMFAGSGGKVSTWTVGDLSDWDVSKATNLSNMFYDAGHEATTWYIGNVSRWNVSNVTNMSGLFGRAGYSATNWSVGDLTGWDVSKVTNMSSLFADAGGATTNWSVGNLSTWNVSNVKNMNSTFYLAGGDDANFTSLDLTNWDVSSVTNMGSMFAASGWNATTWSVGDISGWNTSNVTNMTSMFSNAGKKATTWVIDLSRWDTSNVTSMAGMFGASNYGGAGHDATTWSIGDISGWDVSKVTNMNRMFAGAGNKTATWTVGNLSRWDVSSVTNMASMFGDAVFDVAGGNATTWSVGDISGWDTSNVTSMEAMFARLGRNTTSWSVGDISGWDVSKVTTMKYMFYYAGSGVTNNVSLNLSNWNTVSLTNAYHMFEHFVQNANSLSINLSNWKTSSLTDMTYMFSYAGASSNSLSINISKWDLSAITKINSAFSSAGSSATNWSIAIPATNNAGINNTATEIYGATSSVKATIPSTRAFTLVAP